MPITIDAVPRSPTANAFVTVAEAGAYLASRPFVGATWSALSDDDKAARLIAATDRLDVLDYLGWRATLDQRLAWPRDGALRHDARAYYATDEIPRLLREATIELALVYARATTDPTTRDALSAFASLKIPGVVEFTLDGDRNPDGDSLPPAVLRKLAPLMFAGGETVIVRE